jgi:hypothetical protein
MKKNVPNPIGRFLVVTLLLDLVVDGVEQIRFVVGGIGSGFVGANHHTLMGRWHPFAAQTDVVDFCVVGAVVLGKVQGQVVDRGEGDDSEMHNFR